MPMYTVNDWDYSLLTNVMETDGVLTTSGSISGSVITEIVAFGDNHAGPTMITIDGMDVDVYYMTDLSTDWILCTPTERTEYILTSFDGEIYTEFDIDYITNLQFEDAYRRGEVLTFGNEVGYARVNYSTISTGEEVTNVLTGSLIQNNSIKLADVSLIPARSNIAIVYTPKNFVLDNIGNFLLLKVIFKSFDSYLAGINIEFRYNTYENILYNVPAFYRRI